MIHWLKRLRTGRNDGAARNKNAIDSLRYVVLDTELTSLDSRTNRILSIGALAMDGAKIRLGEQFYRVLNPEVAVPEKTIVVHGLRPKDVEEGEPPDVALSEFREFAEGAVLVGHFLRIDVEALKKELGSKRKQLRNPTIDTAAVHRWLELRKRTYAEATDDLMAEMNLASVAEHYGVEARDEHHALSDAFVTARLWQKLLHHLQLEGIRTLRQLRRVR